MLRSVSFSPLPVCQDRRLTTVTTGWCGQQALFTFGLNFSSQQFSAIGLGSNDTTQLKWMAETSLVHRTKLAAALQAGNAVVPKPCTYAWHDLTTPLAFLQYSLLNLQNGVSGLLGGILQDPQHPFPLLASQIAAGTQGMITILRQFLGLFPDPTAMPPAIPSQYHWTLAIRDYAKCPAGNPVPFNTTLPALLVSNQPVYHNNLPALSNLDFPSLTKPNDSIAFSWLPNAPLGPFNQTASNATKTNTPSHAVFITQDEYITVPLTSANATAASTKLPAVVETLESVFGQLDVAVNGTAYITLTDSADTYTAANLSAIVSHTFAGPTLYRAG